MTNKEATKYLIKPTATTILPSEETMKQFQAYRMAIEALNREPVIKKQESVVHAHWKWELAENGWVDHICSNCGFTINEDIHIIITDKYCRECGAKMDERD